MSPAAPCRARARTGIRTSLVEPAPGGAKPAQPLAHPGLSSRRWRTRLAWPGPALLTLDPVVPGGLAAGAGDTPASRDPLRS